MRPGLAARQRAGRQRGQQSSADRGRLPAARRPDDGQQPATGELGDHRPHEPLAAAEEPRVLALERRQPFERADRRELLRGPQRGVVAQDRGLHAAELLARLEAHLAQRPARVLEGLQRLGLAPAAVEREHAPGVQALAQRLLGHQRRQPRHELELAAGGELGIDLELERDEPQLVEPAQLGGGEGLVGHVAERIPAPQRERFAGFAVAVADGAGHEVGEARHVDRSGLDAQLVAAATRDDRARQQLAQLRDVALQHLRRRRRRIFAPQPLDQAIDRHRAVRVERQHRQQRALLGAAQRHGVTVERRLYRREEMDLQRCRRATLRPRAHAGQGTCTKALPPTYRSSTATAEPAVHDLHHQVPHRPVRGRHLHSRLPRRPAGRRPGPAHARHARRRPGLRAHRAGTQLAGPALARHARRGAGDRSARPRRSPPLPFGPFRPTAAWTGRPPPSAQPPSADWCSSSPRPRRSCAAIAATWSPDGERGRASP